MPWNFQRGFRLLTVLPLIARSALSGGLGDSQDAPVRRAIWGQVTPYTEATTIDSPVRQSRNALWDGKLANHLSSTSAHRNDSSTPLSTSTVRHSQA